MTPQEMALKLASASATCGRHKCPLASQCHGCSDSCGMKEVALMLRAQQAEIDTLNAMIDAYKGIIGATQQYTIDLEKTNKRYHDIIVAFYHGYRAKNPQRSKKGYKRHLKPKDNPVEMDGDERYAYEEQKDGEPDAPLVMI